jgi:hypothetical protein
MDANWHDYIDDQIDDSLPPKFYSEYPEFPDGFPSTWTTSMIEKYKKLRIDFTDNIYEVIDNDVFDFLKESITDIS